MEDVYLMLNTPIQIIFWRHRPETIDEYIRKLDEYDWVQTTIKITDALGSYKDRTVDRNDFFLIQAPDAYSKHCMAVSIPITLTGIPPFNCRPIRKAITHFTMAASSR